MLSYSLLQSIVTLAHCESYILLHMEQVKKSFLVIMLLHATQVVFTLDVDILLVDRIFKYQKLSHCARLELRTSCS